MDSCPITLEDCLWLYYSRNFATVIAHGVIIAFIPEVDYVYEIDCDNN